MDFSATVGTEVYATGNGMVTEAGRNAGYGNEIIIDHGYSYKTVYAHLSRIFVKPGQKDPEGPDHRLCWKYREIHLSSSSL